MDKLENSEKLSALLEISDEIVEILLDRCDNDVQDVITVLALTTGEFAAAHQYDPEHLEEAVSCSYQQTLKDQAARVIN